MQDDTAKQNDKSDEDLAPNFLQVMWSVVAASFGVQNDKNYERDFKHGKPVTFILAGLLFTVLFILGVMGLVQLALPN